MKLAVIDHQNKGYYLAMALSKLGHTCVDNLDEAEVLFASTDAPFHKEYPIIERFGQAGKPVYLYPHSAAPSIEYDGLHPASGYVTSKLVTGPGHREILGRYGYPRPIYQIGWFYCPLAPFRAVDVKDVKKVLFAPMHPWADGKTIRKDNLWLNRSVFNELASRDWDLMVRYFGSEASNGIPENASQFRAQKIDKLDNSLGDIDEADLVVACGTFAYLAIARGRPTIMFGQKSAGLSDAGDKHVENWELYETYLAYKADFHEWPLPMTLAMACEGGDWLEDWKRKFIGPPLNSTRLARLLGGGIEKRKSGKHKPGKRKSGVRMFVR